MVGICLKNFYDEEFLSNRFDFAENRIMGE
jgi:hypothetical protein